MAEDQSDDAAQGHSLKLGEWWRDIGLHSAPDLSLSGWGEQLQGVVKAMGAAFAHL